MLDGDGLGDHPAHRRTEDVRPLDAEVIEQADSIGCHVRQGVRDWRELLALEAGRHDRHRVGGLAVEMGRQPTVAVVEADDVSTVCRQLLTEGRVPGGQLGGEAHHEEECGVVR